jgi:hypothetical protein
MSGRQYACSPALELQISGKVNYFVNLVAVTFTMGARGIVVVKHYAAIRKVAGSRPVIMFLGSKVRPVRKADNLTATCEPTV